MAFRYRTKSCVHKSLFACFTNFPSYPGDCIRMDALSKGKIEISNPKSPAHPTKIQSSRASGQINDPVESLGSERDLVSTHRMVHHCFFFNICETPLSYPL